ncbi:MAG: 50S ribosomal protein L3 N(5)-glutamine methyltransferase [Burkholderiales bacterium]
MNLRQLVRDVAQRLRGSSVRYGHGTSNAADDAAYLVLRGLNLPFDAPADREVARQDQARIERLLRRRIHERIPVAYLLNESRRVIIPRSHIAALLQERLRPWLHRPVRRALDLCTGTGCLAILAAKAFPRARVDASDLSSGALAVAARNVERHRLAGHVHVMRSDLFASLGRRRYDLIVTNPPYVQTSAMRALPREYRHEPRMALAGGNNGLDLVHRILQQARAHLAPCGMLVCEIGRGRKLLERTYARTPFAWPLEQVFVLAREDLPRA